VSEILRKTQAPPGAGASAAKVLPRELIQASAQAERMIEAARQEAELILVGAAQARQQAVDEGFQQGFDHGASQWAEALRRARERTAELAREARPEVVRLALRVAEKILRQRIELSPEAMLPMVDEALRVFLSESHARVVLRVHPDDAPALQAREQRWRERHPAIASLAVVPDEAVGRGGCRIETESGTVDATLETQLDVIERHLLGEGSREP
jgi:flagellar biosynthesis/type III secretory pathway protein FliH